jgi:hypothetical protein
MSGKYMSNSEIKQLFDRVDADAMLRILYEIVVEGNEHVLSADSSDSRTGLARTMALPAKSQSDQRAMDRRAA